MGFSLPKQPQNYLAASFKMDIDFLGLFWREEPQLIADLHKTDLDIWGHSRGGGVGSGGRGKGSYSRMK